MDKPELTRDVGTDTQPELTRDVGTDTQPTTQPNMQPTIDQVTKIVSTIHEVLNGKKITQGLIIRVVANCMTVSAQMKIPGEVKKRAVINALEQYIKNNSDLSENNIDLLMAFVDTVVSEAIDVIADVATGKLSFKSWFSCCR